MYRVELGQWMGDGTLHASKAKRAAHRSCIPHPRPSLRKLAMEWSTHSRHPPVATAAATNSSEHSWHSTSVAHVAAVGCGRGVGAELMEDEGDAICSAVIGSEIDAELDAEGQADVDLVDVPRGSLLSVGGGGELHAIVAQCGCTACDVELRQTRGAGEQQEEEQDSMHADAK